MLHKQIHPQLKIESVAILHHYETAHYYTSITISPQETPQWEEPT